MIVLGVLMFVMLAMASVTISEGNAGAIMLLVACSASPWSSPG
jgi:hypothetical protein